MPLFLMDTHALHWRRVGSARLSPAAAQVFADGIAGKALLLVPHVVIAELFFLLQKHHQVPLFAPMLHDYRTFPYNRIEPLDLSDLASLETIPEISEMHDRLLAFASKRLGAVIVTCDPVIQASQQVRWLW
jgi:PIN domain nuclease of toxin-antitoxin system